MKIKILSAPHHLNQRPIYDAQGRQTGVNETSLLEVIAIPLGSDPQHSPIRYSIQFSPVEKDVLLKMQPGVILDAGELVSAAGEAANTAYEAAMLALAQAEKIQAAQAAKAADEEARVAKMVAAKPAESGARGDRMSGQKP